MSDIIKNQKLFFISLIGIVVVSLALSTTFAYQAIRVNYSEGSDNELSVSAGVLDVEFTTSNKIELNNMSSLPDYSTADYVEFTIDNSKSTEDVVYYIDLENKDNNNELISKHFKYTLVLNDITKQHIVSSGDFENLNSEETFSLESSGMPYFFIKKGAMQTMRLYLWLSETSEDISNLEGKSFERTIKITSLLLSEVNDKKLTFNLLKDTMKEESETDLSLIPKTEIGTSPNVKEKTISLSIDDYGVSYYYRGNVNNNYLEYKGYCYRIIRVQGDGTIKLLLANEGSCNSANETTGVLYTKNELDENIMYSLPYSCDEINNNYFISNSCIVDTQKKIVDNWYINNYDNDENLVSTNWCLKDINSSNTYKCNNIISDKAGLLSIDELVFSGYDINNNIMNSYISNEFANNYNILSNYIINNEGIVSTLNYNIPTYIRPVIVMDSSVNLYKGDGTKENPYIIENDPTINIENGS